jgi:hypothetical protein
LQQRGAAPERVDVGRPTFPVPEGRSRRVEPP